MKATTLTVLLALTFITPPVAIAQTARRSRQARPAIAAPTPTANQKTQPSVTPPAASHLTAKKEETSVTIDELFAVGTYSVYAETRSLVEQFDAPITQDLINPLRANNIVPVETESWMRFVKDNRAALALSRIAIVAMSSKPDLPQFVVAIETASADDARTLEPQVKRIAGETRATIDKAFNPTRTNRQNTSRTSSNRQSKKPNATGAIGYRVQRFGATLLVSDKPVSLRALRPAKSASLIRDARFREMQARFGGEQFFVFSDFKAVREFIERQQKEAAERASERQAKASGAAVDGKRKTGVAVSSAGVVVSTNNRETDSPVVTQPIANQPTLSSNSTVAADDATATLTSEDDAAIMSEMNSINSSGEVANDAAESDEVKAQRAAGAELGQLSSVMFGTLFNGFARGYEKMDAIGAGYSIRGDALTFRVLAASEDKIVAPVPFMPFILSGANYNPQSPNILPADTGVFASFSLDLPRMYDQLIGAADASPIAQGMNRNQNQSTGSFASRIAALEAKHNIKLRDELLASVGDEVAVGASSEWILRESNSEIDDLEDDSNKDDSPSVTASNDQAKAEVNAPPKPAPSTEMFFVIALQDKARFQKIMPYALALFGIPVAPQLKLIEARDGYETVPLANGMVAFIGDYLVITPDAQATQKVVDAVRKNSTLAANSNFLNARNWQQGQKIGELYVASEIMKRFIDFIQRPVLDAIGKENNPFAGIEIEPQPVTYSLTRDALGAAHELHIPQTTLQLMSRQSMLAASYQDLVMNDAAARSLMYQIYYAQLSHRGKILEARAGAGNTVQQSDMDSVPFASVAELKRAKLLTDEQLKPRGYRMEIRAGGTSFEVSATPEVFGKTGRRSFFINHTGNLRGGDLGGRTATATDKRLRF